MNPLRLNLRFRAIRRPLSLARALTLGRPRFREVLDCASPLALLEPKVRSKAAEDCRSPRRWRADRTTRSCFRAALGILATLAFAFGLSPAQAAVIEAWVHRYSNNIPVRGAQDRAVQVVRDASDNVIVAGVTAPWSGPEMLIVVKYSGADGSLLWEMRSATNGTPLALAVDENGNPVVAGYFWNGTNKDFCTAKYAGVDGALLWEKRYNGPANGDDYAVAVAVDAGSNVAVLGFSSNAPSEDYYTAKYAAADGALLWERRYNGPARSWDGRYGANILAMDSSGNVVVAGNSFGTNRSDYYIAKYAAANGAIVWEKRYDGPANSEDFANSVAVDGSGNVVVTGYSESGRDGDYYTAKYAAADGALLWGKRYNGPAINGSDYAYAVAVDSGGNVVVTGMSHGVGSVYDYYTAKYAAADGVLLWEKRYNGPANDWDEAQTVAMDARDNVIVTGYSSDGFSPEQYTAKYAGTNGALLWEKRAGGYDQFLAVDSIGNVVASRNFSAVSADICTAKYAETDGALLWESRYDGPTGGYYDSIAQAVAVDHNGNVVVTGFSDGETNRAYTAKYAAATGALLWERRSAGGDLYGVSAVEGLGDQAVALDGRGDVVIMGTSYGDNYDYYTAKFAAADGALLWEQRYAGPTSTYDYANAMAVDAVGNVVVTGISDGGSKFGPVDYYTAKYAAADGALLWEKHASGGGRAVAVDSSGNVVVTGFSNGAWVTNGFWWGDSDYYTAKYAAADGVLLWERRYRNSTNSHDSARAVAVDNHGNVVVTGYSYDGNIGTSNGYTAKYAATDGALLWEKRTSGGGQAVAVDGSGDVVVMGISSDYRDYYTVKFAAADGTLVWEQHYNTGNIGGKATGGIALDANGNVAVTGITYHSGPDFYTAKYASADGALLWERHYNGPANGAESMGALLFGGFGFAGNSHSLALGPNGMVAITGTSTRGSDSGPYDFATVVYLEILPAVSIDLVPTGVRLRFTGESGRNYRIERAPAVTGNWSTITSAITPVSGIIEYVDTDPRAGAAFYRAVVQP